MDKYLKESRDFWRDRALFLAREAVKDEERHGRALAAREAEVAELLATNHELENLYKTVPLSAYDSEELSDELAVRGAPYCGSGEMADLIRRNAALRAERDALRAALAAPPPGDGAETGATE